MKHNTKLKKKRGIKRAAKFRNLDQNKTIGLISAIKALYSPMPQKATQRLNNTQGITILRFDAVESTNTAKTVLVKNIKIPETAK